MAKVFTALLSLVIFPLITFAGLNGDSVTATMSSPGGSFKGFAQFSSPATIGPGVEFTTVATDVFNQVWDINLDLSDSSFTINWTERTRGTVGNIGGTGVIDFNLIFDQPIISNVSFSSYVSTGFFSVAHSALSSLTNDSSSIMLDFDGMQTGDTYTFDVTTVPEPSSLLLAGLAALLLWPILKRKRSTHSQ